MTQPQPNAQNEPIDTEATAAALGRIPSGLFVVTWRGQEDAADATDRVMLASWIMQGGFAPPLITIAVGASRDLLNAIDQCTPFVVNVLGESQRSLVGRFGKPAAPGEDPFAGLDTLRTPGGTAALAAAAGWIECRGTSRAAAGDHVVVVAEVVGGDSGSAGAPLVHVRKNGLRY